MSVKFWELTTKQSCQFLHSLSITQETHYNMSIIPVFLQKIHTSPNQISPLRLTLIYSFGFSHPQTIDTGTRIGFHLDIGQDVLTLRRREYWPDWLSGGCQPGTEGQSRCVPLESSASEVRVITIIKQGDDLKIKQIGNGWWFRYWIVMLTMTQIAWNFYWIKTELIFVILCYKWWFYVIIL